MPKKIIIFLILLFLVFGCTTDTKTIKSLDLIQEKYGVNENFSLDSSVMSSYINEISELQAKNNTQLLRFELYSSQAFYYLLKANEAYDSVDYQNESCKSIQLKNAYTFANFANSFATKAIQESNLPDSEKQYLRENQVESMTEYKSVSKEIIDALIAKCGKI